MFCLKKSCVFTMILQSVLVSRKSISRLALSGFTMFRSMTQFVHIENSMLVFPFSGSCLEFEFRFGSLLRVLLEFLLELSCFLSLIFQSLT